MALVQINYCNECCKTRYFLNGECPECRTRQHREKMAAWQAKTVDEKLLDIHKRLLKLEAAPLRY